MGRSFLKFLLVCVGCCVPFVTAFGMGDSSWAYEPEELSCVANTGFVKCARLPTDVYNKNASDAELYANIGVGTWVDDSNWTHFRNGVPIVGHAENVTVTPVGSGFVTSADCVVTEPFNAKFVGEIVAGDEQTGTVACSYTAQTVGSMDYPADAMIVGTATALDGDVCPDGFFTVPYESWCGEGMVNISDAPNCDDDTSGEFCLIDMPSSSPCVSTDTVTKCARFPIDDDYLGWGDYVVTDGVALSDNEWRHFRNGIPVYGTASIISSGKAPQVECVVSSPFVTSFVQTYPWGSTITQADAVNGCATLDVNMAYEFPLSEPVMALSGDVCPDGFYTVPYEISCGEGLVDVTGVPHCNKNTSGEFCFIGDMPVTPCAAGITVLRTGTGVSIPLWSDKNTTPALAVRYNNMTCWGNLQSGQVTNGINIKYNNQVYHLVE